MNFLISFRFHVYALAWVALTWFIVHGELVKTRAAYEAGDLSAYAWTGFLPFFLPVFGAIAAMYVVPAVALIEFLKWCFKQ